MDSAPFRLGIIDYLNAAPLHYGFKHGLGYEHFHLKFQVPSACAEQLKHGEVDAALISSIEFLRIPDLLAVPGLCIASPKRVRSVVILSKVPPEEIRSLALDFSSRTSVVMGQLVLRERYGIWPEVHDMGPDLDAMLQAHDAALLIGDVAMRARREGLLVMDLAEEWHAWTGLPFVFALWMVRKDAARRGIPEQLGSWFHRSLEQGEQNLSAIIEEAWRSVGWTKLELREYFTENLHYRLGAAEQASLALFYDKAVQHGFAPASKSLQFL